MTTETALLARLLAAAGGYVPRAELAEALPGPARTLPAELAALGELGYQIEAHPHHGYRLTRTPDRLIADDLRARFAPRVIGREIIVFDSTTSTNDVVERLAKSGQAEGVVVFAETQTKGRGRQGRAWSSPRGKGLWFSVLLRPALAPTDLPRLTVMAGVAVARALRKHTRLDARIKWPNDVIVADRKLAGILTEWRAGAAIVGIGVDVNCRAEDFPAELRARATSVATATGAPEDRARLAALILAELDAMYAKVVDRFESITDEWARLTVTLGRQIVITRGARSISGLALALDGGGALLVRRDSGAVERVTSGDLEVTG